MENLLGEIGRGHVIAFNILNIGRYKLELVQLVERNVRFNWQFNMQTDENSLKHQSLHLI